MKREKVIVRLVLCLVLASVTIVGRAPLIARGPLSIGPQGLVNAAPNYSPSSKYHVVVGHQFAGVGNPCGVNCVPPDVQVAAGIDASGMTHVVEMVNTLGEIFSVSGTVEGTLSLPSIFGTGTDFISDPKIIFDSSSVRWYASITGCAGASCNINTNGYTVLVMSHYKDPFNWYPGWRVNMGVSFFSDQPKVGISDDKVVLSSNEWQFTSPSQRAYLGAFLTVYNLNDMTSNPTQPPRYRNIGPLSNVAFVFPVHDLTYGSTTQYLVSTWSPNGYPFCDSNFGSAYVAVYIVTGVPPNTQSTSTVVQLPQPNGVQSFLSSPPNAPQRSQTAPLIDTGNCRVQDAIYWNHKIWLSANDACTPSNDNTVRSCIQIIQMDVSQSPFQINQDFDLGYPNYYLFYPALRLNNSGDLSMVFGYSSALDDPSIAVAGHGHDDQAATMTSDKVILGTGAGVSACSDNRYGDYFGAGLDPGGTLVWVAGEYYSSTTHTWATSLASMQLST